MHSKPSNNVKTSSLTKMLTNCSFTMHKKCIRYNQADKSVIYIFFIPSILCFCYVLCLVELIRVYFVSLAYLDRLQEIIEKRLGNSRFFRFFVILTNGAFFKFFMELEFSIAKVFFRKNKVDKSSFPGRYYGRESEFVWVF